MSTPIPAFGGLVDSEGVLHLDAISLYRRHSLRLRNKRVRVTLRPESRPKSRSQLGYLFGIVYAVIAEESGYREYEVEQVHDALMRTLRGLQPEPNPLQLRVSLKDMSHDEVSRYIEDVRHYALTDLGIVTPDANSAEVA